MSTSSAVELTSQRGNWLHQLHFCAVSITIAGANFFQWNFP